MSIELLCSSQAIDFLRPLHSTQPLERLHSLVRTVVKPWDCDRYMTPDIEAANKLLHEGKVWAAVKEHVEPKFHNYIPLHKEVELKHQ